MSENNQLQIVESFGKSLLNNVKDISIDFAELGIDEMIDNEMLKNIPIIQTINALYKVGMCVRDRYLCEKLVKFINELNKGNLVKEEIDKHIEKLGNKKIFDKELENLLMIIDSLNHVNQASISARIYLSYLREEINWEMLLELQDINRRMIISDYAYITKVHNENVVYDVDENDEAKVGRLVGLGVLQDKRTKAAGAIFTSDAKLTGIELTKSGELFGRYIN